MDNYEFCAKWVLDSASGRDVRVLDYGCGAGEIVKQLMGRKIEVYGCDIFYDGGDYSNYIESHLFDVGIIKKMNGGIIPFDAETFDYVINNQVMEHVADINMVLKEMHRVLKPGGVLLSLFPDKGVWREGHCGIPFLHWFPSGTSARRWYAAAMRMLGFGYHKKNKTPMRWATDFCEWLDRWTCYRTRDAIHAAYSNFFSEISHIEDCWFDLRLGDRQKIILGRIPGSVKRQIVTKLACMVFVARKAV